MPPRRQPEPEPEPEPKRFTQEDIEAGIRKFQRRIEEVKAIDPTKVRFDVAQVEEATRNFRADLAEVFGKGSPEYRTHCTDSVGYPDGFVGGLSDNYHQQVFARKLPNSPKMNVSAF